MRAALLRLHADMERFGFTQATGFTFELCAPSLRLKRLKELLAEYSCACAAPQPNIVVYG
jgi:hypothetical protein